MERPFEWQAAGGGLHAIPSTAHAPYPPLPGADFPTLCGREVVLVDDDFRRGEHRPTCPACTAAWRKHQEEVAARGRKLVTVGARR